VRPRASRIFLRPGRLAALGAGEGRDEAGGRPAAVGHGADLESPAVPVAEPGRVVLLELVGHRLRQQDRDLAALAQLRQLLGEQLRQVDVRGREGRRQGEDLHHRGSVPS